MLAAVNKICSTIEHDTQMGCLCEDNLNFKTFQRAGFQNIYTKANIFIMFHTNKQIEDMLYLIDSLVLELCKCTGKQLTYKSPRFPLVQDDSYDFLRQYYGILCVNVFGALDEGKFQKNCNFATYEKINRHDAKSKKMLF